MIRLSHGLLIACVACLVAAIFGARRNPGLVTRITQKGVDYAVDTVARELKKLAKTGIPLPDHNGTYDGYIGGAQYTLTDMVVTRLEGFRLGAKIEEDVGLKVSLRIARIRLRGNLSYRYAILGIPISSNRLAFNPIISSITLNFTATLGIDSRAQLTANATDCDASISSVRLNFEPNGALVARLLGSVEDSMTPRLLSETGCRKMESEPVVLINDTIHRFGRCLLGACTLMLILPFVAQPAFGNDYVEAEHAVEILGNDGTRIRPPFAAPRPIRRLREHRRMLTVYLSPYVANSVLYAFYRSGKLAFKVTEKDLLAKAQDGDDGCKGVRFCLARFLARHFLNTRLEVEFSATSCPRFEVSANTTTLAIQSDLTVRTISDNSTVSTMERFPANFFITGKAYVDNNRLCFNMTDDEDRQDSTGVKGGISHLLVKIFERKLLSEIRELAKVGIPLPEYANIRWRNPSLTSVDDAYVLTTDVTYSPDPQTK